MAIELPTRSEYLEGSRRSARNARMLCRAARTLERSGFFGPAIALLATAREEAAKAGVLLWLADEEAADVGDHKRLLRRVFSDHKLKYGLAAWAIGSSPERGTQPTAPQSEIHQDPDSGLWALVGLVVFVILLAQAKEPTPPIHPAPADAASFLDQLLDEYPETSVAAVKTFHRRNDGLYVAFRDGHWLDPGDTASGWVLAERTEVVPLVRSVSRMVRAEGSSQEA